MEATGQMLRFARSAFAKLDTRFRFAEDSFGVGPASWASRLRPAVGIEDGERYLVRLFRKTGTAADQDLKHLIERGLRRIRRVLSSSQAREVLVEVLEVVEVVEDDDEVGIVMLDPGTPLSGSPYNARAREQQCMTNSGRRVFWQNIQRVTQALTLCHDAGIVHGAISEHAIFARDENELGYRLGGYESCVHIADGDLGASDELLRIAGPISFRTDLSDLGKIVASVLRLGKDGGAILTSTENQALNRLVSPPKFQLYDGHIVQADLKAIIDELGRIGSNADGELVLYPARHILLSDLASLTSGVVPADDVDGVVRFAADDLLSPEVRADVTQTGMIRIITDISIYQLKDIGGNIGMIVGCAKRRPDDQTYDALELKHRLYLARNRASAEERVLRLGLAALPLSEIGSNGSLMASPNDPST